VSKNVWKSLKKMLNIYSNEELQERRANMKDFKGHKTHKKQIEKVNEKEKEKVKDKDKVKGKVEVTQ
jgi:hypothetical protein